MSEQTHARVLVVDDSSVNRAVLSAFLKKARVGSYSQAVNGVEAFEKLVESANANEPFNIVLTDYWMPVMNGAELVEKMRADPRFKNVRTYVITADTESSLDGRTELFDGIFLKPITFDKLVTALRQATGQ